MDWKRQRPISQLMEIERPIQLSATPHLPPKLIMQPRAINTFCLIRPRFSSIDSRREVSPLHPEYRSRVAQYGCRREPARVLSGGSKRHAAAEILLERSSATAISRHSRTSHGGEKLWQANNPEKIAIFASRRWP